MACASQAVRPRDASLFCCRYSVVVTRLQGVINFVVRADVTDLGVAPRGELLWGVGRGAVISSDGTGEQVLG